MPLFKDVIVTESININTTPEKIYNYLTGIVDGDSFKTLNDRNVSFRWLKGEPWTVGSVAFAEKMLHGKKHKFEFIITEMVPNKHLEYSPTSKLVKKFFPKKEFIIAKNDNDCKFITSATFRIGWIGNTFLKKSIDDGLSDFKLYLKEEGQNLKKILES